MTTAERLVRQLCRQKVAELEAARKSAQRTSDRFETVPFSKLPTIVREALRQLAGYERQVTRLRKTIRESGYEPGHHDGKVPDQVYRSRGVRDRQRADTLGQITAKLKALEAVQVKAQVAVLGQTPDKARPTIQQLQKTLETL